MTETSFAEEDTYRLELRDPFPLSGDPTGHRVMAARDEGAWDAMQDQCGLWRPELLRKTDGESASTYQFRCT